jgi:type II secretory pathway pseudopilin PulG
MTYRSRSTLFLIEQLIVIAVFAICAAACIRILTTAYFYVSDAVATGNALLAAENCAEAFKLFDGDIIGLSRGLGGAVEAETTYTATIAVYYDRGWRAVGEADSYFVLFLTINKPNDPYALLTTGELSVKKITGESLVAFPVAVRR